MIGRHNYTITDDDVNAVRWASEVIFENAHVAEIQEMEIDHLMSWADRIRSGIFFSVLREYSLEMLMGEIYNLRKYIDEEEFEFYTQQLDRMAEAIDLDYFINLPAHVKERQDAMQARWAEEERAGR